jgi:hypothetical protein
MSIDSDLLGIVGGSMNPLLSTLDSRTYISSTIPLRHPVFPLERKESKGELLLFCHVFRVKYPPHFYYEWSCDYETQ